MNDACSSNRTDIEKRIGKAVLDAQEIVITAHEFPDGDAVGASLALLFLIRNMGKNVQVVLPHKEIGIGKILAGSSEIIDTENYDFSHIPDLLICVDCSEQKRLCNRQFATWLSKTFTINIDHHGKERFGNINYVIEDFSSTGEMIFHLAETNGWKFNRQIAEAIWMSLVTDTNRFSKPTATAETLRCAAELAKNGADFSHLTEQIYSQESYALVQLKKRALNNLSLICNGQVAIMTLSRDDFLSTGCCKQDASEFPLIPFSIQGVVVAAFIYTPPDRDETRISLRSRLNNACTAKSIAIHFGGNGHEDSAGAVVHAPLDETVIAITSYLETIFYPNKIEK